MPLKDPVKRKEYNLQYYRKNRDRLDADHARYFLEHAEEMRAWNANYQREWRKRTPGSKEYHRRKDREYRGVAGATGETKDGLCDICGRFQESLCCEHDHATGRIRGWVCDPCNLGIGLLGDSLPNLLRAIAYFEVPAG